MNKGALTFTENILPEKQTKKNTREANKLNKSLTTFHINASWFHCLFYYENHWNMEWAQVFVQQPLPLSFADLPTFLCVAEEVDKMC